MWKKQHKNNVWLFSEVLNQNPPDSH